MAAKKQHKKGEEQVFLPSHIFLMLGIDVVFGASRWEPNNWLCSEAPTMVCNYAKSEHVLDQKKLHKKARRLLFLTTCFC